MDPLGFSLENFDAVGRWRTVSEANVPLDVSGTLPDGSTFEGPEGLRRALAGRTEDFVTTFTEKLLTYALGRGLEYYDRPAVREIRRQVEARDYRFSALAEAIADSVPFRLRRVPKP